jgi:predicted nucleic acid-binding protein
VRIAIDSNVVICAFDTDSDSKYEIATAILRSSRRGGVCVPLQVLGEVFAVLTTRRKWNATDARDVVLTLMSAMPVCLPSAISLERAMALSAKHAVSFWDAHVLAASAEYGCSILLSEDFQDGRRFTAAEAGSACRVLNPFAEANRDFVDALL